MDSLFSLLAIFSIIALIIGLIKPTLFKMSRGKAALVFSILSLIFLVLVGITGPKQPVAVANQPKPQPQQKVQQTTQVATKSQTVPLATKATQNVTSSVTEPITFTDAEYAQQMRSKVIIWVQPLNNDISTAGSDLSSGDWQDATTDIQVAQDDLTHLKTAYDSIKGEAPANADSLNNIWNLYIANAQQTFTDLQKGLNDRNINEVNQAISESKSTTYAPMITTALNNL